MTLQMSPQRLSVCSCRVANHKTALANLQNKHGDIATKHLLWCAKHSQTQLRHYSNLKVKILIGYTFGYPIICFFFNTFILKRPLGNLDWEWPRTETDDRIMIVERFQRTTARLWKGTQKYGLSVMLTTGYNHISAWSYFQMTELERYSKPAQ